MCQETLFIFYKLTTFNLGLLFRVIIRARLDAETSNSVCWLKGIVAPCRRGVVLPSVKCVCAVLEWRDPGMEVLVDSMMTIRFINARRCDELDIEETGWVKAHAEEDEE